MGIKLGDVIPRKKIDFDDLKKKKIAIDASNMIYQFISTIRQTDGTPLTDRKGNITSHLVGVLTRLTNLIQKNCFLCVCYDGKPPALKLKERLRRIGLKEEAIKKLKKAKTSEEMLKYAKRTSKLTPEMVKESKELIKSLGLPVIQSPSEADAQISFMCKNKDVDYAASSDHDCLLYGCPRLLTNLTLSQKRKTAAGYIKINPEVISIKDVLKQFNVNQDQLIIMATMIGTDYNPKGIEGIGPKKALKLIKQYKDYNKMFKDLKADFNWKKIYKIFKEMPINKNYKLEWQEINEEKVKKLLVDKHDFSEERVDNMIQRVTKRPKHQTGLSKFM